MSKLIEELEEELRQEKLAAGIRVTRTSQLYMPIPAPLSKEAQQIRKENAERSRWEMKWMRAERRARAEAAKISADYLP